jgi:hypothetical protein
MKKKSMKTKRPLKEPNKNGKHYQKTNGAGVDSMELIQ